MAGLDISPYISYYYLMKKISTIILAITIMAILTASLTGCLMVTLRENALIEKLDENGYTIMHTHSLLPFSDERMAGLRISKCFTAYKMDTAEDEQFGEVATAVWEVSVYYMDDSASATALVSVLEDLVKEYDQAYEDMLAQMESGDISTTIELPKRYMVYRYNDIVVFGDWESVSLVRGY